jgi:hypothetical protein
MFRLVIFCADVHCTQLTYKTSHSIAVYKRMLLTLPEVIVV